ncbi:hypothetical protein B0H19DRAFT_1071379 [Mycena capillaripes]|nr:hypothetical protein B0H19DRAFT_1071379 [Mycena capillaripes]
MPEDDQRAKDRETPERDPRERRHALVRGSPREMEFQHWKFSTWERVRIPGLRGICVWEQSGSVHGGPRESHATLRISVCVAWVGLEREKQLAKKAGAVLPRITGKNEKIKKWLNSRNMGEESPTVRLHADSAGRRICRKSQGLEYYERLEELTRQTNKIAEELPQDQLDTRDDPTAENEIDSDLALYVSALDQSRVEKAVPHAAITGKFQMPDTCQESTSSVTYDCIECDLGPRISGSGNIEQGHCGVNRYCGARERPTPVKRVNRRQEADAGSSELTGILEAHKKGHGRRIETVELTGQTQTEARMQDKCPAKMVEKGVHAWLLPRGTCMSIRMAAEDDSAPPFMID